LKAGWSEEYEEVVVWYFDTAMAVDAELSEEDINNRENQWFSWFSPKLAFYQLIKALRAKQQSGDRLWPAHLFYSAVATIMASSL
jgi:hypothetical protein